VFRYVALQWNASDAESSGAAADLALRLQRDSSEWTRVFSKSGLVVFVTGGDRGACTTYPLGEGVVLGTLFRLRDTLEGQFQLVLDCAQCAEIVESAGRELIRGYWGRYVAFLHNAHIDETLVLRDPTGGMPCLWVEAHGVRIFCSLFEDCLQLAPLRFSINWAMVAIRLSVALLHREQCELNEVSELGAGECLRIRGSSCSRSFYWSPVNVARDERIEEPSRAAAEILRTTRMCVQAWASRYRRIIHYLSGGLDSAIVLAALESVRGRTPVCALNYYSPGADGDERGFARTAAERFGCALIEQERSPSADLRGILKARRTTGPRSLYVRLEASQHEARVAMSTGSDGIFSGDGGDVLFFRTPGTLAAVDFVCDHGIGSRALEVALNAACLDEVSFWTVLRSMWRYGVKREKRHSLIERRLDWGAVTPEVVEAVTRRGDFVHPWFRNRDELPPGKLSQAFLLSFASDFDDPLGSNDQPEHACPLLSQPLVELCLRIPTYVLAPGPQDRMLARRAFAADLPVQILRRPTKGGMARHVKYVLDNNRQFLNEFLLDGVLVNQGLLDRKKLLEALSSTPSRDKYWAPEIFEYLGIESWARCWV
jgi:asparagine synthase (glutamine-hydrolysing)